MYRGWQDVCFVKGSNSDQEKTHNYFVVYDSCLAGFIGINTTLVIRVVDQVKVSTPLLLVYLFIIK